MLATVLKPASLLPNHTALHVATLIRNTLMKKERCYLALSGGQSPKALLTELTQQQGFWNQVQLLLVDERWTQDKKAQNQQLVLDFQQQLQEPSHFFPLLQQNDFESNLTFCNQWAQQQPESIDIVLLGMGLDGHTASLFPDAPEFVDAMSTEERYVKVTPPKAPHQRISMSYHWLKQSEHILLFIPGAQKLAYFRALLKNTTSDSPVAKLIAEVRDKITVFSSED